MWILWTIVIGFIAGVLAKFVTALHGMRIIELENRCTGNRARML